jgi:competence protein ComEA
MARRGPSPGSGRLAAVLDPWPAERRVQHAVDPVAGEPVDDAPTQPLPVVGSRPAGTRPTSPRRLTALLDRWVPASLRRARLDPGRPGAIALSVVAAVAAVLAAVGVWREAPRREPVADLPPLVSTTARVAEPAGSSTASPAPDTLVVAVAGKVARPGLVRVPPGSRVADVLSAAGGPLPGADLGGLNLARKVGDGEQVAVGVPAAPDAVPSGVPDGPAAAGGASEGGAPGAPLDLNAATVEQLDGLPGVGPVTAQRIVEWRTRNGRFASVEQLREVEGIGERRFGQLRGLVRV